LRGDELVGKADEGQFQLRHGGGGIWWHFLDEAHYHADIYEAGVFVSQSWRQRRFIAKGAHPKQVGVNGTDLMGIFPKSETTIYLTRPVA
jgi:hypothetical protein